MGAITDCKQRTLSFDLEGRADASEAPRIDRETGVSKQGMAGSADDPDQGVEGKRISSLESNRACIGTDDSPIGLDLDASRHCVTVDPARQSRWVSVHQAPPRMDQLNRRRPVVLRREPGLEGESQFDPARPSSDDDDPKGGTVRVALKLSDQLVNASNQLGYGPGRKSELPNTRQAEARSNEIGG